MTRHDTLARLTRWHAAQTDLEHQTEALTALTGADGESPLLRAVYVLASAHTAAVSEVVGDDHEWLDWYQHENDMGRKRLGAYIGGKKHNASTLGQLARVIEKTRFK